MSGEEVRIKGRFKNVDDFISDLRLVGLHGKFEKLTIEDYGKD